jgi:hypothetical protein
MDWHHNCFQFLPYYLPSFDHVRRSRMTNYVAEGNLNESPVAKYLKRK